MFSADTWGSGGPEGPVVIHRLGYLSPRSTSKGSGPAAYPATSTRVHTYMHRPAHAHGHMHSYVLYHVLYDSPGGQRRAG